MSTLQITEFGGLKSTYSSEAMPAAVAPPLANQSVSISGTSAQSAAVSADTKLVRLISDVNCHVAFAADPTATTSMTRLAADSAEYFQVPVGSIYKIAVIAGV